MSTHSTQTNNPVSVELSSPQARERLVHVALSVLRDGTEAEDAAHDAVEQALRGSGSFRAKSLVSTWLHRVVVNAALMRARRRRRATERVVANDQSGQGMSSRCCRMRVPRLRRVWRTGKTATAARSRRPVAASLSGRGPALRVRGTGDSRRGPLAGDHQPGRATRMCRARAQLRDRLAA